MGTDRAAEYSDRLWAPDHAATLVRHAQRGESVRARAEAGLGVPCGPAALRVATAEA